MSLYTMQSKRKFVPLNRRREDRTLKFIERWLVIGLISLALVETVYQVCLKVMR